jgi:hypothetical protein
MGGDQGHNRIRTLNKEAVGVPARERNEDANQDLHNRGAGVKKAEARAYSPTIVRLSNGRYTWFRARHPLP